MISIFNTVGSTKKERILPAPDLFATCPNEGNILDFYKGQFESVFVLLHPFLRTKSINKELFYPGSYPSKTEILEHCAPVSWREIVPLTGLPDVNAVDIGLRTGIGGLKSEYANKEYSVSIDRLEEATNIVRPGEGEIPELLQNRLFTVLQKINQDWLWVGDEFGTERKLVWIDDLKGEYQLPSHGNLFTPDKSILLTTHWDSHFSFLCSSHKTIEAILDIDRFEGFFCDESTEVYWSINSPVKTSQILTAKE
jgi:hypothetical protein